MKVEDRTATRDETSRLGCFLPDLTRWADRTSAAGLPTIYIGRKRGGCKGLLPAAYPRPASKLGAAVGELSKNV